MSSSSPSHHGPRRRSSTLDLLGNKYIEAPSPKNRPPIPEFKDDPSLYDEDRVKQCLQYADCRLRDKVRIVTPISSKILMELKERSIAFLETSEEDKKTRDEAVQDIRFIELEFFHHTVMRETGHPNTEKLLQELLKFRRLQFAANYGDYLGKNPNLARGIVKTEKVQGWTNIGGTQYMTSIANALVDEAPHWQERRRPGSEVREDEVKCHLTCLEAAKLLHMDANMLIESMKGYGLRNSMMHNGLDEALRDGNAGTVAQKLDADLKELECVFSVGLEHEKEIVRQVIMALIHRWFDYSFHPNNPRMWAFTAKWTQDSSAVQKKMIMGGPQPTHVEAIASQVEKKITTALTPTTGNKRQSSSSSDPDRMNYHRRLQHYKSVKDKYEQIADEFKVDFQVDPRSLQFPKEP